MTDRDVNQHVAVALSGGGHRASLFALGAVLYLVDAGKGPELAAVSSVSGGSLTNAWLGLETDLATIEPDRFRQKASELARAVARGGTLWADWLTYLVLALLLALIVAPIIVTVLVGGWVAWLAWLVAVAAFGVVARQRSRVARHSFDRALFRGKPLAAMNQTIDHVLCATDLQSFEHVYFSGRFVYSYRTGRGDPADLSVAAAAQASAALPGAFPPVSLPLARHRFAERAPYVDFLLTDGGAYDNMASEWPLELADRLAGGDWANGADELVVVNSSAGKEPESTGSGPPIRTRLIRAPLIGEIMTLLAANDVLYDQSTAVRRRLLNLEYQLARREPEAAPGRGLRGTTVQIDGSPYSLAAAFARGADDAAERARGALAALDRSGSEAEWKRIAATNAAVTTTLSRIPRARAASLLRHAYVLTMVNSHVTLGYPLLAIPTVEETETWLG